MASDKDFSSEQGDVNEAIDVAAERRLVWKCDLHVIPILFILMLLTWLDRSNIGNAKIEGLEKELKMKGNNYNVAIMVYFVSYVVFEVPSNLLIKHVAPSTYISSLVFCWGVATLCQGFTKSYAGLLVCRFLIGAFEGGFYPGCIYLIGMYYQRYEFQWRCSMFFSAGIVAQAFGGLFAFALVKMGGLQGYSGWRWIFIIEGLLTIVIGILSKWLIVDWPKDAKFLNADERALLLRRLYRDGGVASMNRLDRQALKIIFTDWKIYIGGFIYLGIGTAAYANAFYVPTLLNEFGYSPSQSQLHSIPIFVVAVAATLLAAWLSDRLHHRYGFILFGLIIAIIGYGILLGQRKLSLNVKFMALFFGAAGTAMTAPNILVWVSNNMAGHYKRAFGSAIQLTIGNMSGFIGGNVFLASEAPTYPTAFGTTVGLLMSSGLASTVFYLGLRAENRKRDSGGRDQRLQLPKDMVENLGDDHPEFRFTM